MCMNKNFEIFSLKLMGYKEQLTVAFVCCHGNRINQARRGG